MERFIRHKGCELDVVKLIKYALHYYRKLKKDGVSDKYKPLCNLITSSRYGRTIDMKFEAEAYHGEPLYKTEVFIKDYLPNYFKNRTSRIHYYPMNASGVDSRIRYLEKDLELYKMKISKELAIEIAEEAIEHFNKRIIEEQPDSILTDTQDKPIGLCTFIKCKFNSKSNNLANFEIATIIRKYYPNFYSNGYKYSAYWYDRSVSGLIDRIENLEKDLKLLLGNL